MKATRAPLVSLEALDLGGATIHLLQVEPLKKISARVFTFSKYEGDPLGGKEYDLVFAKVAGFRLTSLHLPARIQAHTFVSHSPFLNEVRTNSSGNSAGINLSHIQHYQLVTETGQIDVASEIAVCLPIWEP